jgi:hypothetical protein
MYTLQDHIKKQLENPDFVREYEIFGEWATTISEFFIHTAVDEAEFIDILPRIEEFCQTEHIHFASFLSELSILLNAGVTLERGVDFFTKVPDESDKLLMEYVMWACAQRR